MNTLTFTDITLAIDTDASSAFTRIEWKSYSSTSGYLTVTYRSGGSYVFTDVSAHDLMSVLTAADEGGSMGSALHYALLGKKGEKVAA